MLTFFRKIRKSLIDSSSARKYLLYAIGEILLVMIGILLALQVSNWNEENKERRVKKDILFALLGNLEKDEKALVLQVKYDSMRAFWLDLNQGILF